MHAAIAEEPASFIVQIPSWRLDVEREIDVIEEIARLHGYDNFPNTLPEFAGAVVELPDEPKEARVRRTLLALGYDEAMSLTFVPRQEAQAFSSTPAIEIANPLSEEAAFMRTSLLPGMLAMLAWNLNRGNNDVRLFETGRIYERLGDRADERKRVALGATGNAQPGDWETEARPYTFFDMKGDIEQVLNRFEHGALYYDAHTPEFFHPGRSARAVMDGATVASRITRPFRSIRRWTATSPSCSIMRSRSSASARRCWRCASASWGASRPWRSSVAAASRRGNIRYCCGPSSSRPSAR
jgi:phenylalanyl-tRNA synthetase beta chain